MCTHPQGGAASSGPNTRMPWGKQGPKSLFASKIYLTDVRHQRPEHCRLKSATFYTYFTIFLLLLFSLETDKIQTSRCHYTKLWAEASGLTLQCRCTGAPSAAIPIHIISLSLARATCAGTRAQVFQV